MARFKIYVSDNRDNQVFDFETDGIFMSIATEDGANVLFGTEMTGGDLVDWVSCIEEQLEKALSKVPEVYAAVMAKKLFTRLMKEGGKEEE